MPAKIINGDLLNCDYKYIAHQTNCVSHLSNHLAADLFNKFPYADIYTERANGNYMHVPGELYIKGNGKDQRFIINMMAQVLPGKPKKGNIGRLQIVDDRETRLRLFSGCIYQIAKIKDLESIAFPMGVGCGAAKGNWPDYKSLIDELSDIVGSRAEVVIIKKV